jgi:acyl-CoA thioester hydrolase
MDLSPYIFYHKTPVNIRFNDIDMLGHVNNSVYGNFFDTARFEYFRHVIKVNKFHDEQWIVLATMTVDYHYPIFLDDKLIINTKITQMGHKSFDMAQQILVKKNGKTKLVTTSSSVLVCYNIVTEKTCQLPAKWKTRVIGYEKDLHF